MPPKPPGNRRTPRQQRSLAMVDTLVDAGFLCVARHGIAHTTTRHIADLAGVSPGTLYQYFADKDAVFDAMQSRLVDEVVAMLRALAPELVRLDVREGVRLMLLRFNGLLRANDGRYLAFAMQSGQLDVTGHMPRIEQALLEVATQYALHNPRALLLRNAPVVLYVAINGGMFTLLRHLNQPSPMISLEQVVDGIANMVATYIDSEMAPSPSPETPPAKPAPSTGKRRGDARGKQQRT